MRNPILSSYIAKGLLPYRGLGSGIQRAIAQWKHIVFIDDREACLFKVTIHRNDSKEQWGNNNFSNTPLQLSTEKDLKTDEKLLHLIQGNDRITTQALATFLNISKRAVMKQISKLKVLGRLQRHGSTRGGYWEVKL